MSDAMSRTTTGACGKTYVDGKPQESIADLNRLLGLYQEREVRAIMQAERLEVERDRLACEVAEFRVWCDRLEAAIRDHREKTRRDFSAPTPADAELWSVLDA